MFDVHISEKIYSQNLPNSVKKKLFGIIDTIKKDPIPARRYNIMKIKNHEGMYRC